MHIPKPWNQEFAACVHNAGANGQSPGFHLMPSAAANRGDAGSARAVAGSDGIEREDGGLVGSEVCSMASWS
jgi:hypothetical protein